MVGIIENYRKAFNGLSRENWLLSAVLLINRCGYMAVPFMGLYVTQNLHRPIQDAGLIITLFGVGSILGSAVGGKLTDMVGFRRVQIGSAISGGILFFIFGAVTHFHTLCILAVVISFFSDAFGPANFTAIASYANKGTLTRAYSLNRLAVNMGWTLGVSMGGMIAAYDYHLLFIIEGTISIAAGLLIWLLLKPVKASSLQGKTSQAKTEKAIKPWQDGHFMQFILVCAVMTICFFQLFRVVPVFFKEVWHINEFVIGLIMGVNGLVIVIAEMVLISKIESRHAPIYFIAIGALLLALSYLILALPAVFPVLAGVLIMVAFTFGEMLSTPFINTLVIKRSNPQNRGQYAACYNMCWAVAQIVGPSAGFYVAGNWGYTCLWLMLSGFLLCCALGYYALRKYFGVKVPDTPALLP